MTEDVVVIGAGPSGLAIAETLAAYGLSVDVIEREPEPGGIPRSSHHTGYGLRDLGRVMSGPSYARRRADRAVAAGARIRVSTTVIDIDSDTLRVDVGGAGTVQAFTPKAIVMATGARERPRPARWVSGTRPPGVLTTGQLQQEVYLGGRRFDGARAVVVGAEHVSYSAVLTLRHAGVRHITMITEHPVSQSYRAFGWGVNAGLRVPLRTSTRVSELVGRERLTGVRVTPTHTTQTHTTQTRTNADVGSGASVSDVIAADLVVFTADWIPDHEWPRTLGAVVDQGTRGPLTDAGNRTTIAGVFAVGNLVHPVDTADACAISASHAARAVLDRVAGAPWPAAGPRITAERPLRWVAPGRVGLGDRPPRDRLLMWSDEVVPHAKVTVHQGDRLLHEGWATGVRFTTLLPGRPWAIPTDRWWDRVDRSAALADVRVEVQSAR